MGQIEYPGRSWYQLPLLFDSQSLPRASLAQFSRLLKTESLAPTLADLRCLCVKISIGELQRLEMGVGSVVLPPCGGSISFLQKCGDICSCLPTPNLQLTQEADLFVHLSLLWVCGEAECSTPSVYEKSGTRDRTQGWLPE